MGRGRYGRARSAERDDHWTAQALDALGVFGLTTDDLRSDRAERLARAAQAAADLLAALPIRGPGIALIHGPSGGGKSTLLSAIIESVSSRGVHVIRAEQGTLDRRTDSRVVDLFAPRSGAADAIRRALHTLSAAGLADARLAARRVRELSEGERARLRLALAMHHAEALLRADRAPVLIVIDEFCTGLDDLTSQGICATLARWTRTERVGSRSPWVVCASSRDQVASWLSADIECSLDLSGRCTISQSPRMVPTSPFHIERAEIADYATLAPLHYRGSRPATIVRVLAARREARGPVVGVLTVSMPTLNGAWRGLAWPELVPASREPASLRHAAAMLNDPSANGTGVRCISRVIIEPRHRGQGVAVALVGAYLRDPLTPRTEAVAAMGAACPLFVRAGMREWILPRTLRDQRLLAVLAEHDLSGASLVDVSRAARRVARSPALVRALVKWARASRATRSIAAADVRTLIRAAARTLSVRPRAYTSP